LDKKQRLYRLIESYINDSKGNAVQEVYGKGTKIKIHNINFGVTSKYVLIEAVIILGDTINEQTIDKQLANILIQDASVYFFSDYIIKTLIRFDV
jgi:hypothetical protein